MKQHTTFYIVRHGETEWNVRGLLQGQQGTDLTENGKKQAQNIAKELQNVPFEAIYASDLIRAKQTAEIIALERKIAVQLSILLRERKLGPFEGMPYAVLREFDEALEKLNDKEKFSYKAHPELESDEETIQRFTEFLQMATKKHQGKNVLLVTHGGIMRAFLIFAGFETYDSLSHNKSKISNSAYIELKTDGKTFEVVRTVGIEKKQA